MTPEPGIAPVPDPDRISETAVPGYRWQDKLAALLFANFCFLIGLTLAAFPWLEWWEVNYFADFDSGWRQFWLNPYFRGAVSGLGAVNIYISFVEIFRLKRFSS